MDTIKKILVVQKNKCEEQLNKFKEALNDDPQNAFSWSLDAIQASTDLTVINQLLKTMNNPESKATPNSLASFLLQKILNRSQNPHRSTSPIANLTEECLTSSYSKYYLYFINYEE